MAGKRDPKRIQNVSKRKNQPKMCKPRILETIEYAAPALSNPEKMSPINVMKTFNPIVVFLIRGDNVVA